MKNIPILLFILFLLFGCKGTTKVDTGSNSIPAQQTAVPGVRSVHIDQTKTFNGLEIKIGEIALEKGKITIGMTVTNTTKDSVRFYPNQKAIVIGKTQLDASLLTGDKVSGELQPGVERSDAIEFDDRDGKIDPATVAAITLKLGPVYSMKTFKNTEVDWQLELPK